MKTAKVVVFSEKEEYRGAVKNFIENSLCLDNICAVEANYAINNRWIIERLELEHEQGRNIIIIGGYRKGRDFMEIVSWAQEFFRKERVFWVENLMRLKNLKKYLNAQK